MADQVQVSSSLLWLHRGELFLHLTEVTLFSPYIPLCSCVGPIFSQLQGELLLMLHSL